jgi:hypothetical protein
MIARSPAGGRQATRAPVLTALLALAATATAGGAAATAQEAPPPTPRTSAAATPAAPEPASARERIAAVTHAPSLDVRLAPGPHTVGDRIEAVLTLRAPAGAGEPVFPEWNDAWGEAEVVAAGPVERVPEEPGAGAAAGPREPAAGGGDASAAGSVAVYRQRLQLAAFRPGEIPLPPVEVALPASPAADGDEPAALLATPGGLVLAIDSVLPAAGGPGDQAGEEAAEPAPMPPAAPRPLPLGAPFLWAAAVGLAACLAAIAWAVRRARAAAAITTGTPSVPPFEELCAAVAAARAEPSPAAGLTRLSLALRRYLGRALGFPAAESSTAEVRRRLAARRLPADLPRRAVALLAACDLVKFARRPATAGELTGHADSALGLAGDLEAWLHPPAASEGAAESAGAGFGAGAGREAA